MGLTSGPGRILVALYAVFAVSASARAGYQLVTDFSAAPVPYVLSAVAAGLYLVATVALARPSPRMRQVAWVAVVIELVGVFTVGAVSVARPDWFAQSTVWSEFGSGYGYLPAVLPWLGIAWLVRNRQHAPSAAGSN